MLTAVNFNATVDEYKKSRLLLEKRIHELNRAIGAKAKKPPGTCTGELKALEERRRKLYVMCWDIDLAVRMMREYINAASPAAESEVLEYAG